MYHLDRTDRRRRPPGERKRWDYKNLNQRHHEALNMLALGATNREVASAVGLCEVSVSEIKNSTLGQQRLDSIRAIRNAHVEQAISAIQEMATEAAEVYRTVLTDKSIPHALRLRAAKEVLMHPAVTPPPALQKDSFHLHLHQEVIDEVKERGIRAAKEFGMIVELPVSGT